MKQKLITKLTMGAALIVLSMATALAPMSAAYALTCETSTGTATPHDTDFNDSNALNVGSKFTVQGAPYVTAVTFYKSVSASDTGVVHLGTVGGSSIASEPFSFTPSGTGNFRTVFFDSPVPVQSGVDYMVWVHLSGGHYAVDPSGEPNSFANRDFTGSPAIVTIPQGNSGYYKYTSDDTQTPDTATGSNYWVLPRVGDDTAPSDGSSLSVTDTAAGASLAFTGPAADSNGTYSTAPAALELFRTNGMTEELMQTIPGGSSFTYTDVQTKPGTTYDYRVKAVDGCLNRSSGLTDDVTTASATWENLFSSAPANVDVSTQKQMLGMYWQTNTAGSVAGVRFWRGAGTNPSDAHKVLLWDGSGNLLASQDVSTHEYGHYGNNGWGWRDVRFSSPVSVSANTDYVVGYYSSNGQNAYTHNVFNVSINNGNHLSARQDTVSTYNGVYEQGSTITSTGFPTNRAPSGTWYGVDPIFKP